MKDHHINSINENALKNKSSEELQDIYLHEYHNTLLWNINVFSNIGRSKIT